MLRNYLLISLRSLSKHFMYSLINIAGLGLGIATCLLLAVLIRYEISFDGFHKNSDRLYRASLEYSHGGQVSKTALSPTALLPTLQKNLPEIETGARVLNAASYNPYVIRNDEKVFQEANFFYADSTFFDVFSYPFVKGNPKRALVDPRAMVITESAARRFFGNEDPIGKSLRINESEDYFVTGIVQDPPANSVIQFNFIASFSTLEQSHEQIWWSANYQTYLLLREGAELAVVAGKTNDLVRSALAEELKNTNDYVIYNFIKVSDIYLRSDMGEPTVVSSIGYIYGFIAIAFLIIAIACINYINLATAKAADRAKEVGIRKVVGALRKQLFLQFIGESAVITTFAFILAFLVASVSLPMFNSVTGRNFSAGDLFNPSFLSLSVVALVGVALFAGAYPAIAIAGFKPTSVLKGNFKSSGKGIWLRQSLVVFQFTISIVMIVGTFVIINQLRYLQDTQLGYNKDNVIMVPVDRKTRQIYPQLRDELFRTGQVAQTGRATDSPTLIKGGYNIALAGNTEQGMAVTAMTADTTFIPTLGIEIIAGRNFSESDFHRLKADTVFSFILNETALKELYLSAEKAIGTKVALNGRQGEIVGVVRDFHFASLHTPIRPLVLFNEDEYQNILFIKLKTGNVSEAIASLKNVFGRLVSHRPFEYEFLDQRYAATYAGEQRIGTITGVFASFTIIIACLGLFGLVSFSAAQKKKEIGIRKVLGATASGIVVLIARDYAKLVVIAIVIGIPLSYYTIENWYLSTYAYRTSVGAMPFVVTAVAALLIAAVTSSYQAIKAANINPTETLRSQ